MKTLLLHNCTSRRWTKQTQHHLHTTRKTNVNIKLGLVYSRNVNIQKGGCMVLLLCPIAWCNILSDRLIIFQQPLQHDRSQILSSAVASFLHKLLSHVAQYILYKLCIQREWGCFEYGFIGGNFRKLTGKNTSPCKKPIRTKARYIWK